MSRDESKKELETILLELRADLASIKRTFDLRWKADMRAIKMWQDGHPERELTWPDRADLVVWLLERGDEEKLRLLARLKLVTDQLADPHLGDEIYNRVRGFLGDGLPKNPIEETRVATVARIADGLSIRLNNHLVEMKEGYDDSIAGFNEAWDIVREFMDRLRE